MIRGTNARLFFGDVELEADSFIEDRPLIRVDDSWKTYLPGLRDFTATVTAWSTDSPKQLIDVFKDRPSKTDLIFLVARPHPWEWEKPMAKKIAKHIRRISPYKEVWRRPLDSVSITINGEPF